MPIEGGGHGSDGYSGPKNARAPSPEVFGITDEHHLNAVGAFSHDIRSPLTAMRMVLDIARRDSGANELILDAQLAEMLTRSLTDLQTLADELQEASRLQRGKLALVRQPCSLVSVVDEARELVGPRIAISGDVPDVDGEWDPPRLARALASFARTANLLGDGSGTVTVGGMAGMARATVTLSSGVAGEAASGPVSTDAGFRYFAARLFVLGMGGTVVAARGDGYFRLDVSLPLE
jgi:hypothetical protein